MYTNIITGTSLIPSALVNRLLRNKIFTPTRKWIDTSMSDLIKWGVGCLLHARQL